jgi:hypothetical protein
MSPRRHAVSQLRRRLRPSCSAVGCEHPSVAVGGRGECRRHETGPVSASSWQVNGFGPAAASTYPYGWLRGAAATAVHGDPSDRPPCGPDRPSAASQATPARSIPAAPASVPSVVAPAWIGLGLYVAQSEPLAPPRGWPRHNRSSVTSMDPAAAALRLARTAIRRAADRTRRRSGAPFPTPEP